MSDPDSPCFPTEFHVRGLGDWSERIVRFTLMRAYVTCTFFQLIVASTISALFTSTENFIFSLNNIMELSAPNEQVVTLVEEPDQVEIASSDDVVSMAPFKGHKQGNLKM